jgi:hypothetical protein
VYIIFIFRFATVSELRSFYVDVPLIIIILDLYKMETIRFNIACQMISLSAMEETKEESNSRLRPRSSFQSTV